MEVAFGGPLEVLSYGGTKEEKQRTVDMAKQLASRLWTFQEDDFDSDSDSSDDDEEDLNMEFFPMFELPATFDPVPQLLGSTPPPACGPPPLLLSSSPPCA
jgi:hypothetical protein